MKKAKNAFAVIAIVLAVIAAVLTIGLPYVDLVIGKLMRHPTGGVDFGAYFGPFKDNLLAIFKFDYFSSLGDHVAELVVLGLAGVGAILFIVLFILMLAKKHAKGLGWWFPMLIIFAASVGILAGGRFDNAGFEAHFSITELPIFGKVGCFVAIGAAAFMLLAVILYMAYVCAARANAKKVDSAREAALAKIESLLGGNN